MALLISCHQERNEAAYARLQLWDSLLEEHPEVVADSLSLLDPKELSHTNRAYYGLLKTIADDKTYAEFTSDSLINTVTNHYSHSKEHKNYVRALTYQGIVRVRMGNADSTAYIPFKAAIDRITRQKKIDTTALYVANYYLAYLNGGHRNFSIAHKYYIEALNCIRLRKDTTRLFDVYYSLYWNYLKQEENEKAYSYLDSLNSCCRTPQEKYYLLSAQSVFYDLNGNDKKALQAEKEQLQFLPQLKEKPEYFRIYYSISDQYHRLNQLDSAMFYAQKAIEHIQNSTYKLNYIFYENVAEIAEAQHNYQLASSYRKKALDIYNQSIEKQKDTHILELEKRSDLSKAENKTLRAEKRNRLYVIIMLLFVSLAAFLLLQTTGYRIVPQKRSRRKSAALANRKNIVATTKRATRQDVGYFRQFSYPIWAVARSGAHNGKQGKGNRPAVGRRL